MAELQAAQHFLHSAPDASVSGEAPMQPDPVAHGIAHKIGTPVGDSLHGSTPV